MQDQCLQEIERAFATAEKHYGRSFPRVPVVFSNRMTHCAGRALYEINRITGECRGHEIRLSAKLLASEGAKFVKRTPGHEVAHIVSAVLYGHNEGKGHGFRWKEVMQVLGLVSTRCHSYTTPKRRAFKYTRNGITKTLTIIRHNRLQRGKVQNYCWKDGVMMFKEDFVEEVL